MEFIDLKSQYDLMRQCINERIQRVLDHAQYIMGPEVRELELRLESYTQSRHCITVSSGTEALLISLMSLGVGPGDEVVTTPFTFVSTAEVILRLGARPVFVDIEPDSGLIDANLLESAITARTRAIIPVSLYGQPADMNAINDVAVRHGLTVIEDAAQSFGAGYKGRRSCNLSTIGCTSFFPSKPLGCYGDGGALFTNDDQIAQRAREIRVHGQSKRYVHTCIGVGGRMDTLQCAIVLAKLDHFSDEVARRQSVATGYAEKLADQNIQCIAIRPDRQSVYAQFTVMVEHRDAVRGQLDNAGIPSAVHYPMPLHLQPAYAGIAARGELPVAESVAQRVLSLPMHPYLDSASQDRIVAALRNAILETRGTPLEDKPLMSG